MLRAVPDRNGFSFAQWEVSVPFGTSGETDFQLAEPGGVCISQTVYDQVRKIVEILFEDLGERRLKNIAEPIHVYRIVPSPLHKADSLNGLASRPLLGVKQTPLQRFD